MSLLETSKNLSFPALGLLGLGICSNVAANQPQGRFDTTPPATITKSVEPGTQQLSDLGLPRISLQESKLGQIGVTPEVEIIAQPIQIGTLDLGAGIRIAVMAYRSADQSLVVVPPATSIITPHEAPDRSAKFLEAELNRHGGGIQNLIDSFVKDNPTYTGKINLLTSDTWSFWVKGPGLPATMIALTDGETGNLGIIPFTAQLEPILADKIYALMKAGKLSGSLRPLSEVQLNTGQDFTVQVKNALKTVLDSELSQDQRAGQSPISHEDRTRISRKMQTRISINSVTFGEPGSANLGVDPGAIISALISRIEDGSQLFREARPQEVQLAWAQTYLPQICERITNEENFNQSQRSQIIETLDREIKSKALGGDIAGALSDLTSSISIGFGYDQSKTNDLMKRIADIASEISGHRVNAMDSQKRFNVENVQSYILNTAALDQEIDSTIRNIAIQGYGLAVLRTPFVPCSISDRAFEEAIERELLRRHPPEQLVVSRVSSELVIRFKLQLTAGNNNSAYIIGDFAVGTLEGDEFQKLPGVRLDKGYYDRTGQFIKGLSNSTVEGPMEAQVFEVRIPWSGRDKITPIIKLNCFQESGFRNLEAQVTLPPCYFPRNLAEREPLLVDNKPVAFQLQLVKDSQVFDYKTHHGTDRSFQPHYEAYFQADYQPKAEKK